MEALTERVNKKPGIGKTILEQNLSKLDFHIAKDYLEFMSEYNGGEGFVGEKCFLSWWSVEDLMIWNDNYKVDLYAPGYFIFASDGGGTAYAFNKKTGEIVTFEFVGMLMEDEPILLGNNFRTFLEYLFRK
jgi:hypothetical protein